MSLAGSDWVGLFAAALTTGAFVPQVWQVWRTRSARDISMGMYSLFTAGVFGWLLYGWLLGAWPIIVANGITAMLALAVIGMKLRFDRRNRS